MQYTAERAPQYLTTRQLAERLGIHPMSVNRFRMHGQGPVFIRVGTRSVRYSLAAVEAWEKAQTRTSTAV